jgi:hypothetical protein
MYLDGRYYLFSIPVFRRNWKKNERKHTHLKHPKVDLQTPESKEPQIQ